MSTLATQLKKMYWQQRHNDPLPKEYRRVEYLESTGEQWIDTGHVLDRDDNVYIKAAIASATDAKAAGSWRLNMGNNSFGKASSGDIIITVGRRLVTMVGDSGVHEYSYDGVTHTARIDSQASSELSADILVDVPLYIFASNNYGGTPAVDGMGDVKLYDCRIGSSRRYIPCVRIADNKPGLYDLCGSVCPLTNSSFYINSGTGTDFTWQELPENLALPASLGYVTDGLIAMWDGEYNLGDRHSSTTQTWVDCVGGVRLDWIGNATYEWMDKCCHFLGTSDYGRFWAPQSKIVSDYRCTLEISTLYETVTGSGQYASPANSIQYGCQFIYFPKDGGQRFDIRSCQAERNANQFLTANVAATCSFIVSSPGTGYTGLQAYMNATAAASYSFNKNASTSRSSIFIGLNGDGGNYNGGAARVYCCRAYNRALTQAELQQNYLVDKARFGESYT